MSWEQELVEALQKDVVPTEIYSYAKSLNVEEETEDLDDGDSNEENRDEDEDEDGDEDGGAAGS